MHTFHLSTIVAASPSLYLTICCLICNRGLQNTIKPRYYRTIYSAFSLSETLGRRIQHYGFEVCRYSYTGDLPSADCIHSELHCWQMKWKQQHRENSLPSTPSPAWLCQVPLPCMVSVHFPRHNMLSGKVI